MKTTEHFGLIKPELTDPANIEATNGNWDTVDEQLHLLRDDVDGISPGSVIEQNNGEEQLFWVGTKAEYDAIPVKDPNTQYTVTDENEDTIYVNEPVVLSSEVYGTELPEAGTVGRVFFKVVD